MLRVSRGLKAIAYQKACDKCMLLGEHINCGRNNSFSAIVSAAGVWVMLSTLGVCAGCES